MFSVFEKLDAEEDQQKQASEERKWRERQVRKSELEGKEARCVGCEHWTDFDAFKGLCRLAEVETSVLARCKQISLPWRLKHYERR